ncbi:MAG: FadR/GntR family transcriptional regulator [Chloroflexota bacterium]|nr:FadR/GntR family transcriptional regulator [Chloroflexota bacterium]
MEPIEQKTATELVAQRLMGLLSTGALKPGDRLPPERDLARQLDVGRTTVREALKLLTLSGLLEAKRGDGTYVTRNFYNFLSNQIKWPLLLNVTEVDRIVEVREALEAKAAFLAARRATPEEIEKICVFQQLLEIEGRDLERETEIDLKFHHAIARASHNELLCRLMLSLQDILREYITLSNQYTERIESTVAEHQAIYDAIASRNPKEAEQAMIEHLAISKTWILKAIDREIGTRET